MDYIDQGRILGSAQLLKIPIDFPHEAMSVKCVSHETHKSK